ncbi:MAG: cohesin domain-containing protein [Deltaproteobacteria bacterium]|nr:cohesin domain-containing protein [Deltaproteobacteria bacterium]
MKKFSVLALASALLILGGCSRWEGVDNPTGPSTVSPKVFTDPSTVSVKNGDEFTLRVYIENVEDLYYAAFYVVYDPQKVSYSSGAVGDFLKQNGATVSDLLVGGEISAGEGLVKRSFGITRLDSTKGGASGTGVLCTITFNTIATGATSVNFSSDPNDQGFRDVNDTDIQITIGNGTTVNIL